MSTWYPYFGHSIHHDTSAEIELLVGSEWGVFDPEEGWIRYFTVTGVYHVDVADPEIWFFSAVVDDPLNQITHGETYYSKTWSVDKHDLVVPDDPVAIAGRILYGTTPLVGVTVDVGIEGMEVETQAGGQYYFRLPFAWTGTLTPISPFYSFVPESVDYSDARGGYVDDYEAILGLPGKPQNPCPEDLAVDVDFSSFQFSWEAGGGVTDTYDVYIGPNGGLVCVSAGQTGPAYQSSEEEMRNLFGEWPTTQEITWRVDASNSAGTMEGDVWRFETAPGINDVVVSGDGSQILCMTNRGVFISMDYWSGLWDQAYPDGNELSEWVRGVCSEDGRYIIVERKSDGALYRSANWGETWATITPAGTDAFSVSDMAIGNSGQYVIVVGENSTTPADSCYRSSNYGAGWAALHPTEEEIAWTTCDIGDDGQSIIVGTEGSLYASADGGDTWVEQTPPASGTSWDQAGLAGDGSFCIVANTSAPNEFFKSSTTWYAKAEIATTAITNQARTLISKATAGEMATVLGLGVEDSPTFAGLTLSGLLASRLVATGEDKEFVSVGNLTSWISGTDDEIEVTDDGDGTVTIGLVTPLAVSKGGTGAATLTDHGILLGSGTDAVTPLGAATNGQIPIGYTGADPVLATLTAGDGVTITNEPGSITIAAGGSGVDHNSLGGLQGGAAEEEGEYYHLTGAQHTTLAAIAGLDAEDGNFIVGDGEGWVAESGATARTSLGLGTGDSPQFTSLALTATTECPFDSGGWTGRPDPIDTHSSIRGDLFCGNVGGGVGRLRVGSNANDGFVQWNRYYDGSANKQMDSSKPSWVINLRGWTDELSIQRSPAGSTTLATLFSIAGSTGAAQMTSLALTATTGCPLDVGGWTGRPDTISPHANVATSLYCGQTGSSVARLRLGSNPNSGFIVWNLYYGASGDQQLDTQKSSWIVYLNGASDYFAVQRSPAGSTTLATLFSIAGSTGRVGIGTTSPNELLEVNGKIRAKDGFNLNGTDGITNSGTGVPTALTVAGGIVTAVTKNDWLDQSVKQTATPKFGFTTIESGTNVPFTINGTGIALAGLSLQETGELKWAIANRPSDSDNLYFSASPANTNGSTLAAAAVMTLTQAKDVGIGITNPSAKFHCTGKVRSDSQFNLNGADGISITDTVVTALRDNGGQLQYKSKTITFTGGIRTATGTETDWTNVPSA